MTHIIVLARCDLLEEFVEVPEPTGWACCTVWLWT